MVQGSGMVDKECVMFVILPIKEWTKVNSSYNFRTVDLELFSEASSAYTINGAFS